MRKILALGLAIAMGTWGCKRDRKSTAEADETPTAPATVARAPAAGTESAATGAELPWIHDDYPAARKRAREEGLPIVVDLWAAWCHTCLSMQHGVLRDPGLGDLRDRFVWLAVDTEKPENARVMEVAPIAAWPTFYVIDADGGVHARQVGATSVSGFRAFLLGGEKSALGSRDDLAEGSPLYHLREADKLSAGGDPAAAAVAYGKALEAGGPEWDRRGDIIVALAVSLYHAEKYAACADLAATHLPELKAMATAATADFCYFTATCAGSAEGYASAADLRESAMAAIDEVLANPKAALSADDRSEALKIARQIAEASEDEERARDYAARQRKVIDEAVARAETPQEELTYAYHRSELYSYLGEGEAVLRWLEELGDKLPEEYDPHYRLASTLKHLERYEEALKAASVALQRSPGGQRTATIHRLIASIHGAKGDRAAQVASLEAVVALYEQLSPSQLRPGMLEDAREALAKAR